MENQENQTENILDNKERAYATGKRKNSIARVWLKRGSGEIKINGKTLDKYFSLNVKSVYQLNVVENKDDLLNILKDKTVLTFPFNYRADYEADDAFILSSNEHIFVVVGTPASFEFIGLENKEEEVVELEEEQPTEDEFDFGML